MRARSPERDPVRRLSELLRRDPRLLLERWEQLARAEPQSPEAPARPVLREYMPALIDLLAARLERGAGGGAGPAATDAAPCWPLPCEATCDLCAVFDELGYLRAALFDLSEAEGVRLTGRALLVVHAALDEALMVAAGSIARCAVAAATRERERLDLTLRLLPVGVFISDARGRFLTMNEAAVRLWGTKAPMAESIADYGAYRAYRSGTNEPLSPGEWGLARALGGEGPIDQEVDIVTFDSERKTIVNSALALRDPEGNITGGVAVNVDVTDRKRTELERAREAEFRERLIGIVGHDLRTPLSAILFVGQRTGGLRTSHGSVISLVSS